MSNRSKEMFNEIIVGFFVAGVFALLIFFTIVISGVDLIAGRKKDTLTVLFPAVGGLRAHDNVVVRGMPVGTVKDLQLAEQGVRVQLSVDRNVVVRENNYRVRIASSSLLGGNMLTIDEGDGTPLPRSQVLVGEAPSEWMRDLGETLAEVKKIVSDDDLIGSLRKAATSLANITARLENGEGTLGKLLSSDDKLYQDLSAAVASLRNIAGKIETGDNSVGKLINDKGEIYANFQKILSNTRELTERLQKGEGTLGKLMSANDTLYNDLTESVAHLKNIVVRMDHGEGTLGRFLGDNGAMYTNLYVTTENLRLISEKVASGEGTLGKLTMDDKLYRDAEGLLGDVRETVDNLRESTPLTTFGSILMGGL